MKIGDKVVIFTICCLIALFTINKFSFLENSQKKIVVIEVSGKVIKEIPLEGTKKAKSIEIKGTNGGFNLITMSQGKVWVSKASCLDKICISMGSIHQTEESVVCLPNRVVIKIISTSTKK